jgi:hypothetical protein
MVRLLRALAVAAVSAGLSGCVSWASYPAGPGEVAVKNPNDPTMLDVMVTGLQWVIRRYPPGAGGEGPRLAINLPAGMRERVYQRVAVRVGQGAVPLTTANATLPIYHVAQVRVRGDEAAVDILRPVTELGPSPSGEPVYQEVRVNLRGGVSPWHVVSHREWTPGAVSSIPELNYMDRPVGAAAAAGGS